MIYLHGTDERQRAIADGLSQLTIDALKRRPVGRSDAHSTEAAEHLVKINHLRADWAADVGFLMGAPGRIRTRDPLLRRHLGMYAVLTCEDAGQQRAKRAKAAGR